MSEPHYTEAVKSFYDGETEKEWGRLLRHSAEFEITRRFMDRYVKAGDSVLDVGGGPGRYSVYLAGKGCKVTLLDLSPGNVATALVKANEAGVEITAVQGDARYAAAAVTGAFDHVLVMGPMYHLIEEADRKLAMAACLKLLKPGGLVFASYISIGGGLIYLMKNEPGLLGIDPHEQLFVDCFIADKPFSGDGFTKAHFEYWRNIVPFMDRFGLEKLHLFGQEGVCAPCEFNIMAQPAEVVSKWMDLSERVCEKEELLCFSEHHMYIGRKPYDRI